MMFPPVFLARCFPYFRWKRLLAWSRMYADLFGSKPPCVEYFVDFLNDFGEGWLAPADWSALVGSREPGRKGERMCHERA